MITLDEAVLARIAREASRRGFGFARHLLKRERVPDCCGGSIWLAKPDYNAAKAEIALLDRVAMARLLSIVGTPCARMVYTTNGEVVEKRIP